MKAKKNKDNKFKLSDVIRGFLSLFSMGVSVYIIYQNNRILEKINSDSHLEGFKMDFNEIGNDVPLSIHRNLSIECEDEEFLEAKRRYLTG